MSNSFSPILVSKLIILPLRYFFANYTSAYELVWNEDEKVRTIEIDHANNFNKVAIQKNPRILVARGDYNVQKTGLTDNFAEPLQSTAALPLSPLKGSDDRVNFVFVSGNAQIIIEARNQGTCELVTDMVSHFIVWSRPLLCDTQRFKEFGLPMSVSDCTPDTEDTEKFRVTINIPYIMEESWTVRNEALALKNFFLTL